MANKVLIEVIATSKGLKVVAKDTEAVVQSTKKLEKEQKKTTRSTKKQTDAHAKYDKQNKSVMQGNLSASKSFSKMKETIGGGSSGLVQAYATLAANVFAATAAFTALRQASQVTQLVEGLQALGAASGKNLELLAVNIKEAAGQAIALDQALRTASVGASAGFSSTQIEGLASVARDAAIALGRDVGDAVDRLTRGAAKLEPEILDELGIFVRLDDASAKYAASIGVASSELTRFQQRQAFANEIIEQGGQKFGELGDKVEASPFDQLAATLGDLSRTIMDAFNSILGPVAGFLSNNTVALAGLFAVLSKGIIATALPMLNTFSESAQKASLQSMAMAEREEKTANRKIQQQRKALQPLKMVKGEYGELFKKIKKGTATIEEQELANKKLLSTISIRQKNVNKGALKNIQQKQQELKLIKDEQRELQKLINLEKGREGSRGAAKFFGAQSNFDRRGGKILGNLDKDIASGDVLGGFNKAIKAASRNSGKLMKDTRAASGSMKILGFTASGPVAKGLRLAGTSFKIFGLSGKIAIKGLFTAIPVIGQLLLVVDLLIAGLKKAVAFFANFKGEASELEKTTKNLEMSLKGVDKMMSQGALANKSAGEALIIQANATGGLIDAMEAQSEAQAKAREEASDFGKILMNIGDGFEVFGMKIANTFQPVTQFFANISLNLKLFSLEFQKSAAGLFNVMAHINNFFADDSAKIEIIDPEKLREELDKEIFAINQSIEQARLSMQRLATNDTLDLLDNATIVSAEFKAMTAIIKAGGPALNELSDFMGTDNINTFVGQIDGLKKGIEETQGESLDLTKLLESNFSPAVAKLAENFVKTDKDMNRTVDVVGLLGAVLTQGTASTVDAGKAAEELGETFKNSGEKINKFFTGLKEKSKLGPMLTEFKNFETLTNSIRTGEGGDIAFLEQFEKAPASLQRFLTNTKEITNQQQRLNQLKSIETDNLFDQVMIQQMIEELSTQIADGIEAEGIKLKENLNTLIQFELIRKKELALLDQQNKAISKVKNNSAATSASVDLQNTISRDNVKNLQDQNVIQNQLLTAESQKLIAAGDLTSLTDEQREVYAKILTNNVAIAKEGEKIVGEEEKALLIKQANLENDKLKLELANAQVATLVKTTKLLNLEANIRAGIGGKLTPAQQLKAQRVAAAEAVKAAIRQQQFQITKFEIERDILELRLLAAGVDEKVVKATIKRMNENFETNKKITAEKVKQARLDEKMVGKDQFSGLLGDSFGARQSSAIDLARESIAPREILDEEGEGTGKFKVATTQEKLEALSEATKPMRDALIALGPEGELVATAQQGLLTMASAFDVIKDKGLGSSEGIAAVGATIGAVSQIMAANSKAQIAEIDKQIAAEKKRDGKSKESLAKIKELEKKKEAMEKKAFERNKKMQMAQIIANTAAGVMKTMGDTGFFGAPLAMMVAAMGAAQLAIVAKTKFEGGSTGDIQAPNTNLQIGKRNNAVDVSRSATSGELNFLRGGRTTGQDLGGAGVSFPGSAMGRKGYAMGFRRGYADGGVVVGERGPEVITPSSDVDIVPNFALGGGETNVNFSINAIDAAGVEDVLTNQRGNIIRMIREAANENGERFLETVDTQTYGSNT
tara:strand:+ start:1823 stop:6646 length:4824 start_codon:yes stop_codon:yes gene_type:complete